MYLKIKTNLHRLLLQIPGFARSLPYPFFCLIIMWKGVFFKKSVELGVAKPQSLTLHFFSYFCYPKVAGERYVYKFVCDPEALFSMAFPDNQRPLLKTDMERHINEEDTVPLSHFDESMVYVQDGGCCNTHPYNEGYVY